MTKVYDSEAMDKLVTELDAFAHERGISLVGIVRCFFNRGDEVRPSSIVVALGEGLCGGAAPLVEAALRHTGEMLVEEAKDAAVALTSGEKSIVH
jgi:hypothetical protein